MKIESILTPKSNSASIPVTVDPYGDEKKILCVPLEVAQDLERENTQLRERCKSYAEREDSMRYISSRNKELERAGTGLVELLQSARAIAQRKGEGTAWKRFDAAIAKAGIGSVTPRTFRILGDDDPELLRENATAQTPPDSGTKDHE